MTQTRLRPIQKKYRITLLVILLSVILCATTLTLIYRTEAVASNQARQKSYEQDSQLYASLITIKLKHLTAEQAKAAAAAQAKASAQKKAAAKAAKQAQSAANVGPINSKDCTSGGTRSNPESLDIIVNKKHCIQPLDFVPSDLTTVNGATLSAKASGNFAAMFAAAKKAGRPFSVTSSYRSYQTQISTYNYWVNQSGATGADTYSARPGYSEHQTGLSVDLAAGGCALDCFGSTKQYVWLQAHAADYGFIQRYYKGYENITGYSAEEWHYRYVGVGVAKAMKASGVKTLEQYWGVDGGGY